MIEGITLIRSFWKEDQRLYKWLDENVVWDDRMYARKTASFGVAYNYSQMSYPYQEFPPILDGVLTRLESEMGFEPNNCLINYYLNGQSKMGYHSDQVDILHPNTGVAILSLGEERILRFRNILDKERKVDFALPAGSLIYMTQEVQSYWHHAVPKSSSDGGRMSLTFRNIRQA